LCPILIFCHTPTKIARTPKIRTIAATSNTVGILLETLSTPAVKLAERFPAESFSEPVSNPAPVKVETITKAIITPITNEATPNTRLVIKPPVCAFIKHINNLLSLSSHPDLFLLKS